MVCTLARYIYLIPLIFFNWDDSDAELYIKKQRRLPCSALLLMYKYGVDYNFS